MPELLACPQGHRWQAAEADWQLGRAPPACPQCGAPAALPSPEAVTIPPDPRSGELPAPDRVRITGYEVLGELGRGGMGVVYKARHEKLKRLVALKMVLTGAHAGAADLARFRREAEAVACLQHPGIVQIYEVGEQDGRPFLALEFVDGGSLDRRLAAGPLGPHEAAALVEGVARAVHAAHRGGVIHRDLKPANVLLTADGQPKITDFGLAKQLGQEQGHTRSGTIMGTPGYMAPEQAGGKTRDISPATDVWALGVILYECLTGRPPFRAETPLDTALQVLELEPAPPRALNPRVERGLETVCLKCLEKDPRRRYATALQLAEDLRRYLQGEPVVARPPGLFGRVRRWAERQPALATTLAALAVFYAVHLVFLLALDLPGEGGAYHASVTALALGWAASAVLWQQLVQRPGWASAATVAWAGTDVLLFTLLLWLGNGPRSELLVGYLLLTAGAALRFRAALVWAVTGLCLASYAGLVVEAQVRRPELLDGHVPGVFIFLLCLLLMGLMLHLLLRRVRDVSAGTPATLPTAEWIRGGTDPDHSA